MGVIFYNKKPADGNRFRVRRKSCDDDACTMFKMAIRKGKANVQHFSLSD